MQPTLNTSAVGPDSGVAALFNLPEMAHGVVVQVAGRGYRMRASAFRNAVHSMKAFRELIYRTIYLRMVLATQMTAQATDNHEAPVKLTEGAVKWTASAGNITNGLLAARAGPDRLVRAAPSSSR